MLCHQAIWLSEQQKQGECCIMRRKNTTTEMMKEYIAESLLILMSSKPYTDISIGEITTKAGVNRSTYYRNFKSKDEIIKFYFNRIMLEYIDDVKKVKNITLRAYLYIMFSHFYIYKRELLSINVNGLSYLLLDTLNETFTALTGHCTFEERYKLYYHTGGIYNTFLLWFSVGMQKSPEQMSEMAVASLPKGFQPMLL